jgi:hypothetical protein
VAERRQRQRPIVFDPSPSPRKSRTHSSPSTPSPKKPTKKRDEEKTLLPKTPLRKPRNPRPTNRSPTPANTSSPSSLNNTHNTVSSFVPGSLSDLWVQQLNANADIVHEIVEYDRNSKINELQRQILLSAFSSPTELPVLPVRTASDLSAPNNANETTVKVEEVD